jgi:hypothetical protein
MILSLEDALYVAGEFENFFASFGRIDEYMRSVKMERMESVEDALPGMGPSSTMFDDHTMHPADMEFEIEEVSQSKFMSCLELVTSAPVEKSIPGKSTTWFVKEKQTNKVLGMIRFGSPTINSRPRNEWLGKPLDTYNPKAMKRFNASAVMGFNIVPMQPFGYNCLGGKLLAAICCSHYARETLNSKYGIDICLFETTSLYGSTKAVSQYDGMKPFLRHNGLTDSNFTPLINDQRFRDLNAWFTAKNDGKPLVPADASSRKLKTQTTMAAIVKRSLLQHDKNAYDKFVAVYDAARELTEQKRSFYCTYGYTNVPAYLNLETDNLTKGDNFDRFELSEVIAWWRKKAINRYETLKAENRIRTELEVWNENADNIQIIR